MDRREFLQMAAVAAGAAAGDVSDIEIRSQQNRLLELAERDEHERWKYETSTNLAHLYSRLLHVEIDSLCDEPNGVIHTYANDRNGIPLGFEVSTDEEESVGTLVHLSAEQAEALAVDLLEQAHALREGDDAHD